MRILKIYVAGYKLLEAFLVDIIRVIEFGNSKDLAVHTIFNRQRFLTPPNAVEMGRFLYQLQLIPPENTSRTTAPK